MSTICPKRADQAGFCLRQQCACPSPRAFDYWLDGGRLAHRSGMTSLPVETGTPGKSVQIIVLLWCHCGDCLADAHRVGEAPSLRRRVRPVRRQSVGRMDKPSVYRPVQGCCVVCVAPGRANLPGTPRFRYALYAFALRREPLPAGWLSNLPTNMTAPTPTVTNVAPSHITLPMPTPLTASPPRNEPMEMAI